MVSLTDYIKEIESALMLDYILEIGNNLTDDLRKVKYRGNENKYAGHCYVATEALYHLLTPAQKDYWKPQQLWHEGESHWFLKSEFTGAIVDITASQFDKCVDYSEAVGRGFLTKKPSKRAKILISRVKKAMKNGF